MKGKMFYSLTILALVLILQCFSTRLYEHQFPPGSEYLALPRIALFSVYMGELKYAHMPLLLESMRWNPQVDFKVINIIEKDSGQADRFLHLVKKMSVPNLAAVVLTMEEWSHRVEKRLNISVDFNMKWSYKMCDYKPILAYLFPEHSGSEYIYWGFGDLDVVWGNFTRFAGWFQGQHFVITGELNLL
jgi:hypothetical protein